MKSLGVGGAGGELARLAVTTSLRFPLTLLPLLTIATVLCYRAFLFRHTPPPPVEDVRLLPRPGNATLLRLAAEAIPVGDTDVEELRMGQVFGPQSMPLWRKLRRLDLTAVGGNVRLLKEAQRALHDWSRNWRYDPRVMGDLLRLVGRSRRRGLFASCAVVGNSGVLLENEYGPLIDTHEVVIRLNNARITGYERHVGSKTSIAFVNSNILHFCSARPGCSCHPYGEHVPVVMYMCQAIHFLDYVICNISHSAPLLVTDARFDMLCSRIVKYYSLRRFVEETGKDPKEWYRSHDPKKFHYSSGMQAVLLAVGICEEVSIFGFGKSEKAKHHYHTNQKKELDLHDYEAEYMLYNDLIEKPHAVPFLVDSRYKVPLARMYH